MAADPTTAAFEKRAAEEMRKRIINHTVDPEFFGRHIKTLAGRRRTPKDIYDSINEAMSIAANEIIPETPTRVNWSVRELF